MTKPSDALDLSEVVQVWATTNFQTDWRGALARRRRRRHSKMYKGAHEFQNDESAAICQFGPPSVICRIQEVAIPEPGEGEALVQLKGCRDPSSSDIGNSGALQNHDSAADPGADLAGTVVAGETTKGEEVWGQLPGARRRA